MTLDNLDELLKQLRRKEEFMLLKVELAERKALAEWNEIYNATMEEYSKYLRVSYRHLRALQANKADLLTQRVALKEAYILIREAEKFVEVNPNPDPDDPTLVALVKKHLAMDIIIIHK